MAANLHKGPKLIYSIDEVPPPGQTVLLGLQHYLTMFGSTVAIPLILSEPLGITDKGDLSILIATMFFISGITTLLQTTWGNRLPIVQGGTFSFLAPTFAICGMAAFIPSRRDAEVNATALAKVREDKLREAGDGFDGTWVAHPDLVLVARAVFDDALGKRPNQLERRREDVDVSAADLLDFAIEGAAVTEAGLRSNVGVAIRYIAAWLVGRGAVAIHYLMEDAATAEIARSQVWQWVRQSTPLAGGERVSASLVRRIADDEMRAIREAVGDGDFAAGRYEQARELFEQVALSEQFVDFLTLPAYEHID